MKKKMTFADLFKRNRQRGKIEKGAIYVVVFLVSLIFLAYMFVGGTIPTMLPAVTDDLVTVIFPTDSPKQGSLQMYTFQGATPIPVATAPPGQQALEIATITPVACGKDVVGKSQNQLIYAYRAAATSASNNQPSFQVFYGGTTPMRVGVREMVRFNNDAIDRPALGGARDGNNFPLSPAVFVTNVTTNTTNTAGDAQSGGTPQTPTRVVGTWKTIDGLPPVQSNGVDLTPYETLAWPPANGPTGDGPKSLTWTSLASWNFADLKDQAGQALQPGGKYRLQVALHDGATPAGIAQMCVEMTMPGGAAAQNGNTNTGTGTNTGDNTNTTTQPNGPSGNWKLVFNDEFNGTSIDPTKWILCNPSFNSICNNHNNELQDFNQALTNNANVKVADGKLQLIATKQNGKIVSGMVSTGPIPQRWGGYTQPGYKPFQFTYGYYEGKVRFPKGKGFWPSLWMLPDQEKEGAWPGSGEYDVVEIAGNDTTTGYFTAHWGGGGECGHACRFTITQIADASNGWHTYGFDWEPTGLTWYVDGKQVGNTVTDQAAIQNHPFYIMANFSVGGNWTPLQGGPDASTPFPASMDIDYLRVWQKT